MRTGPQHSTTAEASIPQQALTAVLARMPVPADMQGGIIVGNELAESTPVMKPWKCLISGSEGEGVNRSRCLPINQTQSAQ